MEPSKILERCASKFENNKELMLGYRTVRQTFDRFPKNVDESDVLLKVVVLNGLYNTYLLDKEKIAIANHIHKLATETNLDLLLESGKIEAVGKIQSGHGKGSGKERNLYSFATKYCHFSNEKCFPMYDQYVEKVIVKLRKGNYIQCETNLRDPQKFREIIDQIIQKYSLENYTKADRALWIYGRHLAGLLTIPDIDC